MAEHPIRAKKVHGGTHLDHRKGTMHIETLIMPPPQKVVIPMRQHIGAPCTPCVSVGDEVKVGTLVGEMSAPVSAPIYSSVSGKVTRIGEFTIADGSACPAVEIESDGLMTSDPALGPVSANNRVQLIEAVKSSGLVGMGGAGFPTHIKLNIPEDKHIDSLVINCAECEPYITADYRECLENSWDIFTGIYTVKSLLGIKYAYIAIEDNKPEAIKKLLEISGNEERDPHDHVRVVELKSSYPQGAEKVMIKACTGREVPLGKLPADVGVIVMNIASVAFVSRFLKTGMPLVSRRITVAGDAIEHPGNIIAPIGTSVEDILNFCGLKTEPRKIIMGGPMMGTAVASPNVPTVKTTNAILAFTDKTAQLKPTTPCIRCGRCVKNCPMGLMPLSIAVAAEHHDVDALNELCVMACMECGTCVYNCPAGRKLVQSMRLGKRLVREATAVKK